MVSCWIQFSDGSVTPLDLFDRSVYSLTVTSGDKSVATVRRTPQSAFVVAEGEGQGALVKAELRICEECQKSKRKSKLVVGNGLLRVTFQKGSRMDGGVTGGGATGYGSEGSECTLLWLVTNQTADLGNTVFANRTFQFHLFLLCPG